MKYLLVLFIFFFSCKPSSDKSSQHNSDSEISLLDTPTQTIEFSKNDSVSFRSSTYSNKSFQNVIVSETGNGYFEINGESRVPEATFYYFLRQGKDESDDEFVTANSAAPNWGKFNFSINASVFKNNIPLYLVMYESSPIDGSRVNELAIRLF